MNAKERANTAIFQANSEKEKAEKKKSEYDNLIASQKKLTAKRAEELNDQFRIKWQWVMLILIAYSGFATLFTGFKSGRVVSDCVSIVNTIMNIFTKVTGIIDGISVQITGAIGIPESIAVIFVAIVVFGIIGTIMFFGGKTVVNIYQEYCYDEISLLVALVSVVVLIWFAELMPLNSKRQINRVCYTMK